MKKEKPTAKKRVHELAKELNLNSKELVKTIKEIGIPAANHMSALEPLDVERVYQHFTPSEEKKIVEERVRPSVIRRRVKRIVPKPEEEKPPVEEPPEMTEPVAEKPAAKVKPPLKPEEKEVSEEVAPPPVEPEEDPPPLKRFW